MKFFNLCFSIALLLVSCSEPHEVTIHEEQTPVLYKTTISPVNTGNPYDLAGQIHNELMDVYFLHDSLPTTVAGIAAKVESTALNLKFTSLGLPYEFDSISRVNFILSNLTTCTSDIIEASVDEDAAEDFSIFIDSLLLLCETEEDYEDIHDDIVAFEDGLQSNTTYTIADKKTLLIATSIIRHSTYARKKRPKKSTDPEWDLLVGNVAGAIDGADEGMQEAIMRSFIVGVAENQ